MAAALSAWASSQPQGGSAHEMSVATVVAAGLLHVASAHAGDVSVGISIGVPVPPPVPVVVAPPQVVVPAPHLPW